MAFRWYRTYIRGVMSIHQQHLVFGLNFPHSARLFPAYSFLFCSLLAPFLSKSLNHSILLTLLEHPCERISYAFDTTFYSMFHVTELKIFWGMSNFFLLSWNFLFLNKAHFLRIFPSTVNGNCCSNLSTSLHRWCSLHIPCCLISMGEISARLS